MKGKSLWNFLKDIATQWLEDEPFQLAAALSYYTLFSLAPILIIAIAVAGLFFGHEAATNQIVHTLQSLVGQESAKAIQEMIQNASSKPKTGIISTVLGIGVLIFGAGGVVGQLQSSLNRIWGVTSKPGRGIWSFMWERFVSLAMVLGVGFLLLVSLVITTILTHLTLYIGSLIGGAAIIAYLLDLVVSFGFVTILFAMIYKFLPDVRIQWKDVWIGAALTSFLFTLGKFLIGLYLGTSGVTSSFGAAGSLITVLLWVYYSALIFFFGAEFTQIYASRYGSGVVPAENAVPIAAIPECERRESPPPEKRSA
jgi:membrane protein